VVHLHSSLLRIHDGFDPAFLTVTFTTSPFPVQQLTADADRFGLWGKYGGWGNFANFTQYTAQVNSFMPAFIIPFLAWAATAAELSLGIALVIGVWPRWVAFGAATLLFLFGTAMAISFGIKSPLDYSVFSASAGALLLALYQSEGGRKQAR